MRSVCNLVGKWLNKAKSRPALIIMHLITMRQPLAILYCAALPGPVHKVKFIVLVNVLAE